jgi:hypothetical protein
MSSLAAAPTHTMTTPSLELDHSVSGRQSLTSTGWFRIEVSTPTQRQPETVVRLQLTCIE